MAANMAINKFIIISASVYHKTLLDVYKPMFVYYGYNYFIYLNLQSMKISSAENSR